MNIRPKTEYMGQQQLYLETVDSTNTEAVRQAGKGGEHGLLIIAEKQESGKGRRGRSWSSPAGRNIFMTLLLRPSFAVSHASMITLVMAVSVTRAIREVTGQEAKIKWPNDVVLNRKKIVGILTEMSLEEEQVNYLVCGIGINVNQEELPSELKETATSIYLESGKMTDRGLLIERVMECFEAYYMIFCRRENMSELMETYNSFLVNQQAHVRVLDPGKAYEGISHGINEEGELLVEKPDGTIEAVYAGEVSVRGIYGYV